MDESNELLQKKIIDRLCKLQEMKAESIKKIKKFSVNLNDYQSIAQLKNEINTILEIEFEKNILIKIT